MNSNAGKGVPRFGKLDPSDSKADPKKLPQEKTESPPHTEKTQTEQTQPGKAKPKRKILKTIRITLQAFAATWMGIWGGANVWDASVGDGPLPQLYELKADERPDIGKNTTFNFVNSLSFKISAEDNWKIPSSESKGMRHRREATREEWWNALQPTRELLQKVSPEINQWLEDLYQKDKITFVSHPKKDAVEDSQLDLITGKLTLNSWFLMNPDSVKVGILGHEYRHSRQNTGKVINHLISPVQIWNYYKQELHERSGKNPQPDGKSSMEGHLNYVSRIEDEAFGFQKQVDMCMGSHSQADQYLMSQTTKK
ncbi:MAG: hypothetical protein K2X66_14945 [Cyanobacteria bacterium]|nr:hypothetical protein [Cyanobacteriota bacterium]